ncbi:hypothetical protein SAMN05192583_2075 [Sphingomonas gellani]|uniref:Uncharacterized protein n=1 Tax=Sphingomonas gellani TaxID=1166340 RepID=A0A1H8DVW3_9SPHN|nr:hypothetical protein SAMN05192583_2075 [Sphingomonas gellani]
MPRTIATASLSVAGRLARGIMTSAPAACDTGIDLRPLFGPVPKHPSVIRMMSVPVTIQPDATVGGGK